MKFYFEVRSTLPALSEGAPFSRIFDVNSDFLSQRGVSRNKSPDYNLFVPERAVDVQTIALEFAG